MRFGALVLSLAAAAGCSAGALPIEQPPTVTGTSIDVTEGSFLAVGTAVRDAVALVVPDLLASAPGPMPPAQTTRGNGTLALSGTVEQPAPRAATFTVAVALDQYNPPPFSVDKFKSWRFSDGDEGPSAMTLLFTDMPAIPGDATGSIAGSFRGHLAVVDGPAIGTLDVSLTLNGTLIEDETGKTFFQLLHIAGVIRSPAFGAYINDVPWEPAGTNGG